MLGVADFAEAAAAEVDAAPFVADAAAVPAAEVAAAVELLVAAAWPLSVTVNCIHSEYRAEDRI